MADNIVAKNSDATAYTFATDEIGGIHHQYVKLEFGPSDTATIVSTSNGLPVQPATTATWVLGAGSALIGSVSQSGTWNITNVSGTISLPTGASTAAKQPALGTAGTASADVLTIQGITSMTPLLSAQSGTWNVGTVTTLTGITNPVAATQSGTWTVQPGNTPNTSPWLMQPVPGTSGGTSIYTAISSTTVISAAVKASAGQVYGIHVTNSNAAARYVRLYNQTTAPASSDTPVYRIGIPGNTAGAGVVIPIPAGMTFATGIGIRVTGAAADNDTTVLAASEVLLNVLFK